MVSTTRWTSCATLRLALGRAHLAVEIFADDDVGGGLGPVRRDLDVRLFEDDRAFIVADGGGAELPLDLVVGRFAGFEFWVKYLGKLTPLRSVERRAFLLVGCNSEILSLPKRLRSTVRSPISIFPLFALFVPGSGFAACLQEYPQM